MAYHAPSDSGYYESDLLEEQVSAEVERAKLENPIDLVILCGDFNAVHLSLLIMTCLTRNCVILNLRCRCLYPDLTRTPFRMHGGKMYCLSVNNPDFKL